MKDTIKKQCIEWSLKTFGKDFKFRPYQLETIVDILYHYLEPEYKCQVVEAPTGSGKSYIAMVCCGVLWEYYHKRSYILASDLGLIDQYAADFRKYNLNWGVIKGAENYLCTMNNMSFKFGDCKMKNIPYSVLFDDNMAASKGYDCACTCEYVMARKLAQNAPVTLMTYSFWLIQRNSVASLFRQQGRKDSEMPFDCRNFIVCDECHKLGEIVQSQYSPKIDIENNDKILELISFAKGNGLKVAHPKDRSRDIELKDFNNGAFAIFNSKDPDELYSAIYDYTELMGVLNTVNGFVGAMCIKNPALYADKDVRKVLYLGEFASSLYNSLDEYLDVTNFVGKPAMVKNCDSSDKITLNCIFEDTLVYSKFHQQAPKELLLSATIGNSDVYSANIGIGKVKDENKYKFTKIPSTFDFSKSPIYFLPNYKMSMKEKDTNLPIVSDLIYKLFEKHSNERGIVQTGSFAFMNYLFENAPKHLKRRMLIYNDSKVKSGLIAEHKDSDNTILIGPSLTTGISLDGDACRFLIVMKVPYLSLGDKLVAARMRYSQLWYTNQTIIQLQQGFGRGIRYNGDWCTSYVLDGCFGDLLKYNYHLFDKEILDRIIYLQ